MANVLFSKMTEEKFKTITPNGGTFYRVTTPSGQDIYLGDQKLNNLSDITAAIKNLTINGGAIKDIMDALETLQKDETTEGSIAYMIKEAIDSLAQVAKDGKAESVSVEDAAENFDGVTTGEGENAKTVKNVENILAELASKINTAQNAGKLSIDVENGADGSNIAKTIIFYQGDKSVADNKVGELNLPSDMFGVGGEVITIPEDAADTDIPDGTEKGKTYIKINIGAGGEPFYIPVDSLIRYVKGSAGDVITVAVDDITNVITATINDGSIVNKMIADSTIAKTKFAQSVQESLTAADSAVQTVSEGTTAGTISVQNGVNGTAVDVPVHGLSKVATSGNANDIIYKEEGEDGSPAVSVGEALAAIDEMFTWDEVE